MSISVVLWVESPLLIQGLKHAIQAEPDIEVTWCFGESDPETLPPLSQTSIVVLYPAPTEEIGTTVPTILLTPKTVMWQVSLDASNIRGVLPLSTSTYLLLLAIRSVATGNCFIHPLIEVRKSSTSTLTNKELEVLTLLAQGNKVRKIAEDLKLSVKTIEAHKFSIMRKLDVHTSIQLIHHAVRLGLIESV